MAPTHMAAAGFYQCTPESDAVACFCCQVRMEGWHEQDDPITEHQRAMPTCSWNNGTYMASLEERLGSFHTWAIDIKPLPIALAAAGFYHSNKATDGVTCFSCGMALKDWKREDDPIALHAAHTSLHRPCAWIQKVTNQPQQYLPPTPPATPPISLTNQKPWRCGACHRTFSSGSQFHKHRRDAHRLVRGKVGVPLKRPAVQKRSGVLFLGKHKVSKVVHQRPPVRRRRISQNSGSG